jgi:polyribonucleotide nucleotidyltransferase
MIKDLTREVEVGEEFDGKVVRLEDFGAFVELLPGKDGLVHVSEIAWERTNKPADVLKLGQIVKVKVKEIDKMNRINLSMKALLPKPEGYTEPAPRERRPRQPRGQHQGGPRQQRGPRPQGQRNHAPREGAQDRTPKPQSTTGADAAGYTAPASEKNDQASGDTKKPGMFKSMFGKK